MATMLAALVKRTAMEPHITRTAWNDGYYFTNPMASCGIKLLPTNSPDGCRIISADNLATVRIWSPRLEDLTATDWMPVP